MQLSTLTLPAEPNSTLLAKQIALSTILIEQILKRSNLITLMKNRLHPYTKFFWGVDGQ